jgi:hypothetical protein
MFQRFLQKIKKAWTLIKPALGHLATLITILGIGFIGIISPLTQSIEPLRIAKYTKIVEDIRIGSSEKYVESALGIPKRENKLEYVSAKGERYEIIRKDYLNEDFLYSAYFTDEEGLIGIGLISKNKYFRPRIPTKSALALLKYSQENFVPYSPWFIKANFSGTRADNSDFLLEFIGPHLATNGLFIAYGMSELGYINKSEEDYFYDYVVPLVIDEVNKRNTQTIEQILINKKEDRSKINPNTVFVMNELGDYDDSVGFINQEMEYMFLYSRIDYRLLNE